VVTAARGLLLPHSKEQLPNYLYIPVDDSHEQQLGKFLTPVFDFVEKNRGRTNVLVHCYSGISRSAAFIIAYLMRKYGYTLAQALLLLRRSKRRVTPSSRRSNPIPPS
jgi:dual specificity phosphatase 12